MAAIKYSVLLLLLLCTVGLWAHPMPNSVVNLSVQERSIRGEAKMPLADLEAAVFMDYNKNLQVNTPFFASYFKQHIKAISGLVQWQTTIDSISMVSDTDPTVGNYQEVLVYFTLAPPGTEALRQFTFDYTAIIHQVVTHKILVFVSDDWRNGIHGENGGQPVGVIQLDISSEKVFPLQVNVAQGSWWKGFYSMVSLGMQHIKEGTDHLLFLLVLLLPAMLLVNEKRWGAFGGTKYSLVHLLKIVTAFTIGHSVTLLIGALGWVHVPSRPVEVLIAVSILVSAVHAMRPVFPGREALVAAGFGLIHGMAFASVLYNMSLGAGTLAISIFGFNFGIELMQLFIILLIMPWLLLLSRTPFYRYFRITGAALAGMAALGWITERVTGTPNNITVLITRLTAWGWWPVVALAVVSIATAIANNRNYTLKKRFI